jgi:acyl carrier protein
MTYQERLKHLLVSELNLEEITPGEIDDDMPLFGEVLGLDSLDAVELVVILEKHFGIEIKSLEEGRVAFQSINTLAVFVE